LSKFTVDDFGERMVRGLAGRISRRNVLARLGAFLVAAPLMPVLPVARANAEAPDEFTRNAQTKDPKQCTYWRYCAIGGVLCSCCGGGVHTCPPGSTPSPTSWVGTCVNPDDGGSYLIAYRDCCGTLACRTKCECEATQRETPEYRPQSSNGIVWCLGLSTMNYHCSTAVLVGRAE
jgi:methylamine dehydrogenase light chain